MGSLQEELSAALDGAELASADAAPVESSAAAPVEESTATEGRDDQGRITAKPDAAPPATDAAPADAKPATAGTEPAAQEPAATEPPSAGPAMTPPATWSAASKAAWATLPEGIRREVIKREQDFSRGIQIHAEKAKVADTLMREIQPYEAMLRAEGSTPDRAISSLLRSAYVLRTAPPAQKGQLIMQIAQQYGADLSQYFTPAADQQAGNQDLSQVQSIVQQLVSPHLQRIQAWEQQQAQAQQTEAQRMEQDIQGQIEAFQSATREDGTPKHLYFENVRPLMSAYFANGQAQTLEQAYEMACWANPEVRSALIADQQKAAESQRLAEAKRKAQDAGRAGFNVSGQGGAGIAGATRNSLRDELSSQLDAALGGARV